MRKPFLLASMLSLFSFGSAWAQDVPKAELYGGYALMHETDLDMHGFLAGLEGKITRYMGIAGEFGYHTKGVSAFGAKVSAKAYTFMAGPRFSYRAGKARAFAEALVGGMRMSGGANVSGVGVSVGTTAFSFALGGGFDYSLSDMLSIRPAQVDFIRSRASIAGETIWGNDLRYSAGIVIRLF